MLKCPMCRELLPDEVRKCRKCQTDLSLLADYVAHLQEGLVQAEAMTRAGPARRGRLGLPGRAGSRSGQHDGQAAGGESGHGRASVRPDGPRPALAARPAVKKRGGSAGGCRGAKGKTAGCGAGPSCSCCTSDRWSGPTTWECKPPGNRLRRKPPPWRRRCADADSAKNELTAFRIAL